MSSSENLASIEFAHVSVKRSSMLSSCGAVGDRSVLIVQGASAAIYLHYFGEIGLFYVCICQNFHNIKMHSYSKLLTRQGLTKIQNDFSEVY